MNRHPILIAALLLTLLPVLYVFGGCDHRALFADQDVIGAAGGRGVHELDADAAGQVSGRPRRRWKAQGFAGTDEDDLRVELSEAFHMRGLHLVEHGRLERAALRRRKGVLLADGVAAVRLTLRPRVGAVADDGDGDALESVHDLTEPSGVAHTHLCTERMKSVCPSGR